MRFARRESEEPSIDLTSLIDIVFLLLIFFMITTRFIDGSRLTLELPAASQATRLAHDSPIVVVVDARSRFHIGGERVPPERLDDVLMQLHKENPQRRLVLRADRSANHGAVVQVLDIAAAQDFKRVQIAVRNREAEDGT